MLYLNICILLTATKAYTQDMRITLNSELKRLYDIEQLPRYINSSHEWQKSSYDTTGNNDDGFSGKYSFVRKNPDGTLVIFEAKGKGVINRIWTPTPNDDTLDFYFDAQSKPRYSIKFSDLFSGKVFPFVKPICGNQLGGYFCYMPIPFQNGCKIVSRGKHMQFYQIQYRQYLDEYNVETFDPNLSSNEKETLERIKRLWDTEDKNVKDFYAGKVKIVNTNAELKPGQTLTLLNLNKGGRIVGLEIESANIVTGLNKQIDLKITWDNEKKPAVYAPLSDFFGYAFGRPSMESLLLGSDKNKNYCYFPMPFDRSAKIELLYRKSSENVSAESKSIHAKVYYSNERRDTMAEGKFYTHWNKDINPPKGKPHLFLEAKGKGHYVGTILQAQGLKPGMTTFFEGDDSTLTDGIMRIHGTGSEDYFNGGWYAIMDRWDSKMSLPLSGALDYSLPLSRTGGYRLYLNDKLSFNKSIYHSIEHGPHGNAEPVDYTSMALYYSDRPVSEIVKPTNQLSKIYFPDTLMIYPQLMSFCFAGDICIKPGYRGSTFTSSDEGKVRISLAEIPYGQYKLYADIEKEPQGADLSIWQRQTRISDWISVKSEKSTAQHQLYLCDIRVGDFKNTLTILFKTKGDNNKLTLDRLIFVKNKPVKR